MLDALLYSGMHKEYEIESLHSENNHQITSKLCINNKDTFIYIKNKTDVERRQTLGHPRSINPNMINHVPQQSPPLIF